MILGTINRFNKLVPSLVSLTRYLLWYSFLFNVFKQFFFCSKNKSASSSSSLTSSISDFSILCENGKDNPLREYQTYLVLLIEYTPKRSKLSCIKNHDLSNHGSVTKTPRMQPVNGHSIWFKGAKHRAEKVTEKWKREVVKCPLTWQLQVLN